MCLCAPTLTTSNTNSAALSASTSTFLTSLAVNFAVAGGEFAAWVLVRRFIKAVYEPRTYVPPTEDQAPVLGSHILWPLWQIATADPEQVLQRNGVDPYVFLRFLWMMSKAMVPVWLISWAVLLPVDAANSSVQDKHGLDRFTFGNVAKTKQDRYWAHLLLTVLFNAWFFYLVWGEMRNWLVIRQRYLISPEHSRLAQASTVLVTGIPQRYMDEDRLAQLFAHLPGGVKRIWLNRNLKDMPEYHNRRSKACTLLENAQVQIIKIAQSHKVEIEKKVDLLERKKRPVPDDLVGVANPDLLRPSDPIESSLGMEAPSQTLSLADQLVPRSKRPTMRLKPSWSPIGLGLLGVGEKVDTIDWARKEIAACNDKLAADRAMLEQDINHPGVGEEHFPPLSSAFIHFNQQIAAHMARQCLAHNQPYAMSGRYIEQSPSNVVWRNMSLNSYEQNIRRLISYAITGGLIIAWSFPVAFIGALSSITTLVAKWPWLRWIEGDSFGKHLLQGVITGVLPPVLLALLMLLLPFILRRRPSKTEIELDLMTRYFVFLVIHTFLIVTLASGLVSAVTDIAENPSSVATILASQLPTASTFFITLVLTQFTGNVGTLLQPITLTLYYLRVILGGGTPRSYFRSRYRLQTTSWGTQFPGITVYAVIMVSYMVISPIINGFGACFFLFAYAVYKYIFIWVNDQPPQTDTGGLFFPKAITHIFVGMYIQEICLCALFFLARDENGNVSALPQAIIMIIVIACTAAYHYVILASYGPLVDSLPLSLAHMSYGMPKEDGHDGSNIGGEDQVEADSRNPTLPAGAPSPPRTERPSIGSANSGSAPLLKALEAGVRPQDYTQSAGAKQSTETAPASISPPENVLSIPSAPTAPGPPIAIPAEQDIEMGALRVESRTVEGTDEEPYFAVPGGPGVIRGRLQDDANDPMAFFHPATKEPQRVVWLAKDALGLAEAEIKLNMASGVTSTCRYATLNQKGRVTITGPPPDSL